ncbi:Hypothetical protein SCLAV_0439 [Streptomyces clavuligerus]|uniref:Uncharacterized protein n=1 Tax=Streptomyces clavuligerus TaxID=1901 RepID=E2Q995_STRCL|nr:Hypothetical protein SCLAV_0439 [Streptomyces clavuligerus]
MRGQEGRRRTGSEPHSQRTSEPQVYRAAAPTSFRFPDSAAQPATPRYGLPEIIMEAGGHGR